MSEQQFIERNPVGAGRAGARRMLFSADLFRGDREIIIEHGGQHYRLQITKAGKLILNK
jgi:hemin uptake protein HemP